jgi:hypothetical protein
MSQCSIAMVSVSLHVEAHQSLNSCVGIRFPKSRHINCNITNELDPDVLTVTTATLQQAHITRFLALSIEFLLHCTGNRYELLFLHFYHHMLTAPSAAVFKPQTGVHYLQPLIQIPMLGCNSRGTLISLPATPVPSTTH